MKRTELNNGLIRLESANGIRDTRNGQVFSQVVCKAAMAAFFEDAE